MVTQVSVSSITVIYTHWEDGRGELRHLVLTFLFFYLCHCLTAYLHLILANLKSGIAIQFPNSITSLFLSRLSENLLRATLMTLVSFSCLFFFVRCVRSL